jgi:hypothetical protein
MCQFVDDLMSYGARMEQWTDQRALLLLAIRKTYRPVPRWLLWLVWLARWWEGRNQERVGVLRQELFQLEDRRPLHPEARLPTETRLLGGPVYPRFDATTEIITMRLTREGTG